MSINHNINPATEDAESFVLKENTDFTPVMGTLSPGIALGVLFCADSSMSEIPPLHVEDTDGEIDRLHSAVTAVKNSLSRARARLLKQGLKDEAVIFDSHIMIVGDENLLAETAESIKREKVCAAHAYQRRMAVVADSLLGQSSEYMKERAADVFDITRQVVSHLTGTTQVIHDKAEDRVIYSYEVTPSMIGQHDVKQLKGILTETGGMSSHAAILARALGIPAITGYRPEQSCKTGDMVAMDAVLKEVHLNPSPEILADFEKRYGIWMDELRKDTLEGQGNAVTSDGEHIHIYANVGGVSTAESAHANGAEGIGLLRTEFLYINKVQEPAEEEQIASLRDIFKLFSGKPVTVRTLDIGGDKEIPWIPTRRGANPLLGVRGVRLYRQEIELFRTHVRAILRAGNGFDIKIMIPMVSAEEEITFVKNILNGAHKDLLSAKIPHIWPVDFGIMGETPAAVIRAREFAGMVDFFSIGTNDLGQYIMAAERGEQELSELLDPLQPALLQSIQMAVSAAHEKGIKATVCGEMAADPVIAKALLAIGADCLSMNAGSIGKVKKMIRSFSLLPSRQIVNEAIFAGSPEKIRKILTDI